MFRMAVFPQYLDEQKPYKWVQGFWKKQNYTAKENMIYDKVKLKEQLEKLECVKKENQIAPEDAYVAYKDSKFEIVPETEGNTLDFNGAYQALSEAVAGKKRTIDLNSCPAVYVKAAVMKDDPDLKNSLEEMPKSDPDQNRIYIWRRNGNIGGRRDQKLAYF